MTTDYRIGDVFDALRGQPDDSVEMAMFSPPFLALRSYLPNDHPDKEKEIGSETTPAEFIDTMLAVMAELRRVVAGSVVIEIGDTRAGSGGAGGDYNEGGLRDGQNAFAGSARRLAAYTDGRGQPGSMRDQTFSGANSLAVGGEGWPLPKSLTGIPQLLQLSLTYGRNMLTGQPSPAGMWMVRTSGLWIKPNPPVGGLGRWNPVTDNGDQRCRDAHSYLIEVCVAPNRWTDLEAVRTKPSENTHGRIAEGAEPRFDLPSQQRDGRWDTLATNNDANPSGAPPLDWIALSPAGFPGAHFAVYPVELCRRPIQMLCPRRVCRACGQPSRRLLGEQRINPADDSTRIKSHADNSVGWNSSDVPEVGWQYAHATLGWTTCGCLGTDEGLIWKSYYGNASGWRDLVRWWEDARSAARKIKDDPEAKTAALELVQGYAEMIRAHYIGDIEGFHQGDGWRPGIVLDPFGGSGATAIMAEMLGRDAILIDLDERNEALYHERREYEQRRAEKARAEREWKPRAVKPQLPNQTAMEL